MVHEWPRRALWMILVPKTMGLCCLCYPGIIKRRGGLRGEVRDCSLNLREYPRNLWFFPNFLNYNFSAHFNKTLTRIIVQPRAPYFLRPISNPGSRELTGNSWLEAYFLKIPQNFSDPGLYHKTEANQICRLVAYFLSCKQICVSLEFFPLPSKLSKSTLLAFGFFYLKFQQAKRNRKVVDKACKR